MALRTIRVEGDPVLTKVSRPVDKMTPRNHELIMDMLDTMYDAMGVGLAAPQVGILKRIVVIDVGEGPIVLINPEILETSGENRIRNSRNILRQLAETQLLRTKQLEHDKKLPFPADDI